MTILLTGTWKIEKIESSAAVAEGHSAIPTRWRMDGGFSVLLFGYSGFVGWSFYGEQFLEYLFWPADHHALSMALLSAGPHQPWRRSTSSGRGAISSTGTQVSCNLIGIIGLSGIVAKFAFKPQEKNAEATGTSA